MDDVQLRRQHSIRFRRVSDIYPRWVSQAYEGDLAAAAQASDDEVRERVRAWRSRLTGITHRRPTPDVPLPEPDVHPLAQRTTEDDVRHEFEDLERRCRDGGRKQLLLAFYCAGAVSNYAVDHPELIAEIGLDGDVLTDLLIVMETELNGGVPL